MKLQELLNILFETESKTNTIINMVIEDEIDHENGVMALLQEGGAFKVYIESDPNGKKDFIIVFEEEDVELKKERYKDIKVVYIGELESNRIKIHYIQDLMTMQPIVKIDEFLHI